VERGGEGSGVSLNFQKTHEVRKKVGEEEEQLPWSVQSRSQNDISVFLRNILRKEIEPGE